MSYTYDFNVIVDRSRERSKTWGPPQCEARPAAHERRRDALRLPHPRAGGRA